MTDRRTLLKGLAGISVGLILPATLADNAETVRRYWSLDRTMSQPLTLSRGADRLAPVDVYTIRGWQYAPNGGREWIDRVVMVDNRLPVEMYREELWTAVQNVRGYVHVRPGV